MTIAKLWRYADAASIAPSALSSSSASPKLCGHAVISSELAQLTIARGLRSTMAYSQ